MMAKVSVAITVVKFLYEVIKNVRDLVILVEEDDPNDDNKNGEQKKQLVLDLIGTIYDAADEALDIPMKKETVIDVADKATELFVSFYNAIGSFR